MVESFDARLDSLRLRDDFMQVADIVDFWTPLLAGSLNEALAGPPLECVNPNFTQDFLQILPLCPWAYEGSSQWWLPEAYTA